jgi:hypothetical protein
MRTHTLLRQRSDLGGPVLCLTVSARWWYSGAAPVLSGRVASSLVGRQLRISLDKAHRR